jgi:hypothetical protein
MREVFDVIVMVLFALALWRIEKTHHYTRASYNILKEWDKEDRE